MSDHHTGAGRILSVDTMRGFAMVLVMLQHAYQVVDPGRISPLTDLAIYLPTRMASVAFMSVSGMMIAYFLCTVPDWTAVYRRFARRALMLLVVAHTAIHVARYSYYTPVGFASFWQHFAFDFPITTTIGLCLLIAPVIIRRTSLISRAVVVGALLVSTSAAIMLWRPESTFALALKTALFGGPEGQSPIIVGWPLIPWLAIFLGGSLVGEALARVRCGELSMTTLTAQARRAGLVLLVIGLALTAGYKFGKQWLGVDDPLVFSALYPTRTTSLLFVYWAVLLWIFSLLIDRIDLHGRYGRLSWALSVFGRTSLFTYVVQFVFVHSLPALVGWHWNIGLGGFAAIFLYTVPMTWLCSYAYGRMRGWLSPADFSRLKSFAARHHELPAH